MKQVRNGSVVLTVLLIMSLLLLYGATLWRTGAYQADAVYELYHHMQQQYLGEGAFNIGVARCMNGTIGNISTNWPSNPDYASSITIAQHDTAYTIIAILYHHTQKVMQITGTLNRLDTQWKLSNWRMQLLS